MGSTESENVRGFSEGQLEIGRYLVYKSIFGTVIMPWSTPQLQKPHVCVLMSARNIHRVALLKQAVS